MNWTDFIIAIRQGLIPSKKELEANYAPLSLLTAQKMPTGTDLNTCIDVGVYYFDGVATNYVNTPSSTAHNGIMVVRNYGTNRIVQEYISYNTGVAYTRVGTKDDLKPWRELFTTDGGTVKGNVTVNTTEDSYRTINLQNATRALEFALYGGGVFRLYDGTNNKNIIVSNADGTTTFNGTASGNLPLNGEGTVKRIYVKNANTGNGDVRKLDGADFDYGFYFTDKSMNGKTASLRVYADQDKAFYVDNTSANKELLHVGNMASHVLPLDGGGTVKRGDVNPLVLNSTSTEAEEIIRIPFQKSGVTKGYLGFVGTKPMFTMPNYNRYELHHDGNSAKVHIGTSAPSDTSSLWAW